MLIDFPLFCLPTPDVGRKEFLIYLIKALTSNKLSVIIVVSVGVRVF